MTDVDYVRRIHAAATAYVGGLGKSDIPRADYENWQRIRAGLDPHVVIALCDAYLDRNMDPCDASPEPSQSQPSLPF